MVTSSIPVAEVRKPPDVSQPHCVANTGEDKLNLVAPVSSSGVFIFLYWLSWNCSILKQTCVRTNEMKMKIMSQM